MIETTQQKTHAMSTGLLAKLSEFRTAEAKELQHIKTLKDLYDLEHGLGEPLGLDHKLLYLDSNISIGGDILPTANTIGLVLTDNQGQPVSIASMTDKQPPIITDSSQPYAFVVGNYNLDGDKWAVKTLEDGIKLYLELNATNGRRDTVLVSLHHWQFDNMVKHFAKVAKIKINTTLDNENSLIKSFKGHDVELVVTTVPFNNIDIYDDSLHSLLNNAKTLNLKNLEWVEPNKLSTSLPPVKTISQDMLPDILWRYTQNNAERLSVPPEYVAVPLLVSIGSLLGTKVSILPKLKDSWEEVPNLWGAIIGNPSTKKSPALDAGMKPLKRLAHKAQADYEQAQKEFAIYKEINKHKAKAIDDELKNLTKKQVKQRDDDKVTDDEIVAKAQALAEANSTDKHEPVLQRYTVNDSTYQKLGELLANTNNGMLVVRDELTGLLASLEGEMNSEAREFYLVAYNGTGGHMMERIQRGSIFIENHCLSIVGGIQPNKLETYLERTVKGLGNDGFLQRFQLSIFPDHIKGLKERDIAPDAGIRKEIYDLFETIDNLTAAQFIHYGATAPNEVYKRPHYRFTDEAFEVYINWYDDIKLKASECEHTVISEHLMKYPKTVAALALIFHIVDCIENQTNLGRVSLTAVKTAIKWQEMLETHMNRIYSLVTESANIKASYLADKIIKIVKKGADKTDKTDWLEYGFTARQLIRKGWKGLSDKDEVLNALEVLIEHDWLRWETVESTRQGGRPTERYYINPRLSELG